MSNPPDPKNPDQLRREAVEIIQRHKRGLPGYRGDAAPPPAKAALAMAEQALAEGQTFLREARLAEALLRADTVVGLAPAGSPLQIDGWTLRGEVTLLQGNAQTARDAFKRALALNPAHIGARVGMAESFRQGNQHARAIPLYLETIPLVQDVAERTRLRVLLAESYLATGQSEAARRVLRTVESARRLSTADKLRAALTVLVPGNMTAWLVLLLAVTLVAVLTVGSTPLAGIAAFLVSLVTYAALQWWRTPATRRSAPDQEG